jgi:hypothetical protein
LLEFEQLAFNFYIKCGRDIQSIIALSGVYGMDRKEQLEMIDTCLLIASGVD